MKTYFYLSRKRTNAKGLCPIYCRVALDGSHRPDFSTGIFINPTAWDADRGCPVDNKNSICSRLAIISSDVYAIISDCEREKLYSPYEVITRYKQRTSGKGKAAPKTLQEIMQEYFTSAKPNAAMKQRIELVVTHFAKHYDCREPRKLVTDDIKGFERLMEAFVPSTRFKKMQLLKRVFEFGVAKKYLQENPFAFYRLPRVPKSKKIRLDAAERKALEEYSFQSDRLNQVRDMFLFQYNTGFSYADLSCFNRQYVVGTGNLLYLSGTRAKPPHEPFYLPFNKVAQRIADKYNYCLPVISNQKYNAYLKEIADIVGIHKNLTTHVARRTFSQIMIDAGYSGESVALMMGHEDFKTTQQYYGTISEARVEREREKLAA